MKVVLIITGGERQIDLIPENEADRNALKMIAPGTSFRAVNATGYAGCGAGYIRPFAGDGVGFVALTTMEEPE